MITVISKKVDLIFTDGTTINCIGECEYGYVTTEEVSSSIFEDQLEVNMRTYDLDDLPIDHFIRINGGKVLLLGQDYKFMPDDDGVVEAVGVEEEKEQLYAVSLSRTTLWELENEKVKAALTYLSMISDDDAILDILHL